MEQSRVRSAKLQLILSMFIYGSIGIFVKHIPLPSSIIANVRGIVGTLFLLTVLLVKHQTLNWQAIRRNLKFLIPCGILLGFNWIALFEAYRYTTVAIATVCYYLAPVFVLLIAPLLLKERLTVNRCVCAAVALLGMIFTSGLIQGGGTSGVNPLGIVWAVSSAVMYAGVVLLSKKLTDISSYDTTIMELGISAIVLLPYNLLTVDFGTLTCPPVGLILLLVVGIVHTGIAYALYFGSIPYMKAQTAAIFSYIDPIVAILLSALLLREPMDTLCAVGAALVLGSTLVSELLEGRKKE